MKLHNLFETMPCHTINNELFTLHECFIDLKMPEIAEQVLSYRGTEKLEEYVKLAQNIAVRRNRSDVLEQMEFAGLIYPTKSRRA